MEAVGDWNSCDLAVSAERSKSKLSMEEVLCEFSIVVELCVIGGGTFLSNL